MEDRMKWAGATIPNLDPQDPVLNRAAQAWKDRYRIPDNECFAMAGPTPPGFTSTTPNCLAGPVCFLPTKPMIFAHGNE
jgi:hypothetical protein